MPKRKTLAVHCCRCEVCREPFHSDRALNEHLRDAHLLKRLDPDDKFELDKHATMPDDSRIPDPDPIF